MKVFANTKLKTPSKIIPGNEIDVIRHYHNTLSQAIYLALAEAYSDDEARSTNTKDKTVCFSFSIEE